MSDRFSSAYRPSGAASDSERREPVPQVGQQRVPAVVFVLGPPRFAAFDLMPILAPVVRAPVADVPGDFGQEVERERGQIGGIRRSVVVERLQHLSEVGMTKLGLAAHGRLLICRMEKSGPPGTQGFVVEEPPREHRQRLRSERTQAGR